MTPRYFSDAWPQLHRAMAFSQSGMVASAYPLAALIGAQVLREGNSAFDAALSMALIEGVALPWACGLGGDMFCVFYHAKTGRFRAISGSGAAPMSASARVLRDSGHQQMPTDGPLSSSVPGALDAYLLLHEHYGSRPWDEIVQPAIELAESGLIVTPRLAHYLRAGRPRLERFPSSAGEFLQNGHVPAVGSMLTRPHLARTLREISETRRASLYAGRLRDFIGRACQAAGGWLSSDDLGTHRAEIEEPLQTSYRGFQVLQPPLPSQGIVMLEMLNMIEELEVAHLDPLGDQLIHYVAEAKRLAFEDRMRWCQDPRFANVPIARLLSKAWARERAGLIGAHVVGPFEPSGPMGGAHDTTCCCAVDGEGNAIVLIHSLASNWGSGFVVENTGILLNNRAGRGFSLDPDDPNCLEPGKRAMNTLNCCMLVQDKRPALIWGTPGGDLGLQWNVHTLLHIMDTGMDLQSALELPRWHSFPGSDASQRLEPAVLQLEEGFSEATLAGLRRRGHRVRSIERRSAQSAMQIIAIDPTGPRLVGASDPRAEGLALGI